MILQLTDAGLQLMQVATAPIILDSFKLGTAYGYIPDRNQTSLRGSLVYSGIPSSPSNEGANSIKYSVNLGPTLSFYFGEVGLYRGSTLFAVAVFEVETQKLELNTETDTGGNMVIDLHIPVVGENYEMWATVGQSNMLRVSSLRGPHMLPSSRNVVPNVYIIQAADNTRSSYLAYTDRSGLWDFDSFMFNQKLTLNNATRTTFNVPAGSESVFGGFREVPAGDAILQVTSGAIYSTSRYVTRVSPGPAGTVDLIVNAPTANLANAGDTIEILLQLQSNSLGPTLVEGSTPTASTVLSLEVDANGDPVTRITANVKRSSTLPSSAANLLKQKADGLYVDPADVVNALGLRLVANPSSQEVELRDGNNNLLTSLPLLPFTNLTGTTNVGLISL